MAGKIQQIVVTNVPPEAAEYGVVVRPIGGGGIPVDVIIAGAERSDSGVPFGVIVSTSAVLILSANANSKNRGITNNGTSNIYLGADNTVSISGPTMGLKLVPNGTYTDSGLDEYIGEIWGIGDEAVSEENISAWDRS